MYAQIVAKLESWIHILINARLEELFGHMINIDMLQVCSPLKLCGPPSTSRHFD